MRTTAGTSRWASLAVAGSIVCALLVAAPAGAATSAAGLYVSGAGNGHGIGMSQYGAAGYALHGVGYQQILRDYYAQTTLGHVDPKRIITVLLRPQGSAVFTGATTIKGARHRLNPAVSYSVRPAGGRLRLFDGSHPLGTFEAPLQVQGPGPVGLVGLGTYRGALIFRPSPHGGVMTINAVGLDDYVRGVVAAEMPPTWPQQALDAQAVAARTYAITSHPITASFDVYDNTRSQMYEGVKAETPATDEAVAATSGQVVEYDGAPVVTYFFSSSGGETESVQNVFPMAPAAWLVGRPDPFDDAFNNPYHRWRMHFTLRAATARLHRLVRGSLLGIRIIQRGVSPRIVRAEVVGTRGAVMTSGVQLRRDLGAPSTWMSFTTVSTHGVQTSTTPAPTPTGTGTTPTGTSTEPTATGTTPTATATTPTSTNPTGGGGLGSQLMHAAQGLDVVAGVFDLTWPLDPVAALDRLPALRPRVRRAVPVRRYAVRGRVFPCTPVRP